MHTVHARIYWGTGRTFSPQLEEYWNGEGEAGSMNGANLNGYRLVGEEVGQFKVWLASRQVGEYTVTAALNNLNKFILLQDLF